MAKQVKIKEIAKMAGVSAGTVDRVLHKRGKVSQASLEAVERVLDEVGYRYNIHTSAISFRKTFNIAITIPNVNDGEYWNYIKRGINHAIEEYFDVNLKCDFHYYDQFDSKSCVEAYDNVLKAEPDAVIIGPTFIEETQRLCNELDSKNIWIPRLRAPIRQQSLPPTITRAACLQPSCSTCPYHRRAQSQYCLPNAQETAPPTTRFPEKPGSRHTWRLSGLMTGSFIRHTSSVLTSRQRNA